MNKNKRSFTIIELLLALSIFSIIAVSLYSIFWSGIRLSHRFERQNGFYRQARMALALMSKDLENMLPYDFSASYPDKKPFTGTADKITFFIATDDGLKAVSYYLVSPQESAIHTVIVGDVYKKNVKVDIKDEKYQRMNFLVREEKDFADYLNNTAAKEENIEVISDNIKEDGLKFFYGYQAASEGEGFVWKDQWDKNFIPSNLKIEVGYINSFDGAKLINLTAEVLIPTGFLGTEEGS